jgi:hypothetical protein
VESAIQGFDGGIDVERGGQGVDEEIEPALFKQGTPVVVDACLELDFRILAALGKLVCDGDELKLFRIL